jgi:Arginase family
MGRDGGLHTPATTFTGSVDGMVVSHLTGRGAAELVRFWGEPQLVREPDLALFGVERLDPAEEGVLRQSPLRRYLAEEVQRTGAAATAKTAIDRIHGNGNPFVLHLDVDVIADFQATDYPGSGGLRLEEVREALEVFTKQNHLAAIEVAGYNPAKDSDGSGAKLLLGLLADVLRVRYETLQNAVASTAAASAAVSQSADQSSGPSTQTVEGATVEAPASTVAPDANAGAALPEAAPGQAWSSESLEEETETTTAVDSPDEDSSENSDQSDESDS